MRYDSLLEFFLKSKKTFGAYFFLFFFILCSGCQKKAAKDVCFLNDFENEKDIDELYHSCGKLLLLSNKHFTHGKNALLAELPAADYPGISLRPRVKDWSDYDTLKLDIFNPNHPMRFAVRIDDILSGNSYFSRFNTAFILKKGMNNIKIKLSEVSSSTKGRLLNLSKIKRIYFFILYSSRRYTLYFDALRLEKKCSEDCI